MQNKISKDNYPILYFAEVEPKRFSSEDLGYIEHIFQREKLWCHKERDSWDKKRITGVVHLSSSAVSM